MSGFADRFGAAAPACITRLGGWLTGNGFVVSRETRLDRFNQLFEFASKAGRVEVVADRGEWSIALGRPNADEMFHPDQWVAWRHGHPLAGAHSSLDDQVDYVMEHWLDDLATAANDEAFEDELTRMGEDWVRREFGERSPD